MSVCYFANFESLSNYGKIISANNLKKLFEDKLLTRCLTTPGYIGVIFIRRRMFSHVTGHSHRNQKLAEPQRLPRPPRASSTEVRLFQSCHLSLTPQPETLPGLSVTFADVALLQTMGLSFWRGALSLELSDVRSRLQPGRASSAGKARM